MPDQGLAQEFEFSRCEHDELALFLSFTALSARSCHAATPETQKNTSVQKKTSIVCCSNWFLALHVLYYSLQFGTVDAEIVDPLLRTQS